MNLAEFILQYCREHKISKEKLARSANMSRSTLYRMMEKDKNPTLLNLTKLAIAMQVHPQYLIKLEWEKYQLSGYDVTPIDPLNEPMMWFNTSSYDNSHFIAETISDGSLVCVNERFSKTWRIQNTGDTVWENRKLVCQNTNDPLNHEDCLNKFNSLFNFHIIPLQTSIPIPLVKPGETVDLTVEFIAPSVPASVFSYWRIVDENDELCFPESIGVYLQVQVVSAGPAATQN
ncbi:NBR1-Ig-like domain-containing protein [Psychrobacter lutiphocae]|uniref:NBR1-Ig-like domain-containing protein n=1 Tax=Psychrobacter lutiphocae TaxID=540500 RepID=UPI0003686177|nr:NBR1-Ig-like domain-containing protein [Psychrobacter lutiphocae]